jgi:hypothetical protein
MCICSEARFQKKQVCDLNNGRTCFPQAFSFFVPSFQSAVHQHIGFRKRHSRSSSQKGHSLQNFCFSQIRTISRIAFFSFSGVSIICPPVPSFYLLFDWRITHEPSVRPNVALVFVVSGNVITAAQITDIRFAPAKRAWLQGVPFF